MPPEKTEGSNGISNEKSIGWQGNRSGKKILKMTVTGPFRYAKTAHPSSFLSV